MGNLHRLAAVAAAAAALLVAGCDRNPAAPGVSVEQAWARLPAVPGGAGAGYLTLTASADDALIEVTVPGARAQLHESTTSGGVTAMRTLEQVTLPAGEAVRLAPGGRHLMLLGLDAALKPGGALPLTLRFRTAPPVTVKARLVGPGDGPPGHGGH